MFSILTNAKLPPSFLRLASQSSSGICITKASQFTGELFFGLEFIFFYLQMGGGVVLEHSKSKLFIVETKRYEISS